MKKLTSSVLTAAGTLAAMPVLAADTSDVNNNAGLNPITVSDPNTLSIGNVLSNIILWVLGFSAAVAVLFLIIGGLQYITASGNEKRAEAAKQTIMYAVIGLIVILLSFVIVGFIKANIGGVVGQ